MSNFCSLKWYFWGFFYSWREEEEWFFFLFWKGPFWISAYATTVSYTSEAVLTSAESLEELGSANTNPQKTEMLQYTPRIHF